MEVGSIGPTELMVLAVVIVVVVWPFWRICKKAGYPGVLSLLFFVPIVNVVFTFFLALSEWPIERELRQLRGNSRAE